MDNKAQANALQYIKKSKFIRSIFLQTVLIFLIVIIAVIAIVFFSFTSEINKSIISERQKQLDVIEDTISMRMSEVSSVAYNVGDDKSFLLGEKSEGSNSGYEMSQTLSKYLVGNDFIEHLAYYKLSEPDIIYASSGEIKFLDFWSTYLNVDKQTAQGYISSIKSVRKITVHPIEMKERGKSFLAYTCPLPQSSANPQAFVLMLIPFTELDPILKTQLSNCYGEVAVFDENGNKLIELSSLESEIPIDFASIPTEEKSEERFSVDGKKYIMQSKRSSSNSWTYVSVIRLSDIISSVASKQLVFIALLLILMLLAIFTMLWCIVKLYKPINNLAAAFTGGKEDGGSTIIDEQSLLSDTFATLKGDSDQKQKFEAAYYEAEAANKAKSTFLSNMSHDIRTPMNSIVGMTEIAIKHTDDPAYVKDCLRKVRVASQYLLDIINNVLDMSRIESGKFTLSQDVVELPKLVCGIITILNQSLVVKSQRFIAEVDDIVNEKVICDNVRLTQVFMNILSNSVKFTPNGGIITLRMTQTSAAEEGYGEYTFVFTDNGIGMSSEFTKQVFDTFTRDDRVGMAKVEGTGLGMAIAKSFVELMGGTIKCESELGKGTTFTVTMRLKQVDDDADKKTDLEKYSGMSVLILGNEEQMCENQMKLFKSLGVSAEYVTDIPGAVENVNRAAQAGKPYEFVIINQTDSDKSGINAATQISTSTGAAVTYVLAARDMLSVNQSSAYNCGVSAFVQIPLFRSTAVGILDRTFELKDNRAGVSVVNLTGVKVMLVEDNSFNREIAHVLIGETKATIVEATNGKEAVDTFKQYDAGYFDVILMDVQMPVMNGYEATAAIRSIQREDAATVPIFAMTANTFDEDVRQVREAGMNGHLGKPYLPEDLYKILEQAVQIKKQNN